METRTLLAILACLAIVVPLTLAEAARPRAPDAPTLTAAAHAGRVSLAWSLPAGSAAAEGYHLYRGTTGGLSPLATVTGQGYEDAAVTNGVTYRYAVSAYNQRGESALSNVATATPTATAPRSPGTIAFTFDDTSSYDLGAATMLEQHGHRGTFYVVSGYLGTGPLQLSSADVASLHARGHEIGSHSVTHPDLTTVSDAQLHSELADSKATLEGIVGVPVRDFAYPYGAYDARVINATRLHYQSARTADGDVGNADPYRVPGVVIDRATSVATAESYVDMAIAGNKTVFFLFERITSSPGTWDWTPGQLETLLDYVDAKGVAVKTVAELKTPVPPPPRVPGRIVFSFDDGFVSALDAATILENHGRRGTFYVTTGFLRTTRTGDYLSAAEVAALSGRGEDIESHTKTHPDLTTLSDAQLRDELSGAQQILQNLTGKPVRHLAYPFDGFDDRVIAATKLYYKTGRTVDGDVGNPDPYRVPGAPIVDATSLATAESYVDSAIRGNATLVLVFHRITPTPLENDWTPTELDRLLSYVDAKGVAVKTMAQVYG